MSDLPRLVVTAAVIERGGAYFVTRRVRGVPPPGYRDFPPRAT